MTGPGNGNYVNPTAGKYGADEEFMDAWHRVGAHVADNAGLRWPDRNVRLYNDELGLDAKIPGARFEDIAFSKSSRDRPSDMRGQP